jgi:uncharacterized protein (DUF433 family)
MESGGVVARSFEGFPRITADPRVMAGKPCIRGMRFAVSNLLAELAGGASVEDLLREFPYLEREDIAEALRFAAWRMQEREIDLVDAG